MARMARMERDFCSLQSGQDETGPYGQNGFGIRVIRVICGFNFGNRVEQGRAGSRGRLALRLGALVKPLVSTTMPLLRSWL